MRIAFDPEKTDQRTVYALINSTVLPRPIAWISTTSAHGIDNLAPHSYFNVASVRPPMLQFTSLGRKDTLKNIEATGQFVVNLAPESLFERINATSTEFPHDVDEFAEIGIEREPSAVVKPPRVAASPVALECELHSMVSFGHSTVIFGRVVHIAIAESVMQDGLPDINKLRPLARLGKDDWSTLGKVLTIPLIKYSNWPAASANFKSR
jgi:flavin reductase (DIM6/NTAB) family NADH-FMN oxidoreductase RutF